MSVLGFAVYRVELERFVAQGYESGSGKDERSIFLVTCDDPSTLYGIGAEVSPNSRARLLESERAKFLNDEWPRIQERIKRLELNPSELLSK